MGDFQGKLNFVPWQRSENDSFQMVRAVGRKLIRVKLVRQRAEKENATKTEQVYWIRMRESGLPLWEPVTNARASSLCLTSLMELLSSLVNITSRIWNENLDQKPQLAILWWMANWVIKGFGHKSWWIHKHLTPTSVFQVRCQCCTFFLSLWIKINLGWYKVV